MADTVGRRQLEGGVLDWLAGRPTWGPHGHSM